MTTHIPFTPSNLSTPPFQAAVTLDGTLYTLATQWNLAGQRWYINLTNSSGVTVWYGPLIGSPMDYDILLALGLFTTSTLLYRADTGNFEVTP
jgi:hypothetical protein